MSREEQKEWGPQRGGEGFPGCREEGQGSWELEQELGSEGDAGRASSTMAQQNWGAGPMPPSRKWGRQESAGTQEGLGSGLRPWVSQRLVGGWAASRRLSSGAPCGLISALSPPPRWCEGWAGKGTGRGSGHQAGGGGFDKRPLDRPPLCRMKLRDLLASVHASTNSSSLGERAEGQMGEGAPLHHQGSRDHRVRESEGRGGLFVCVGWGVLWPLSSLCWARLSGNEKKGEWGLV